MVSRSVTLEERGAVDDALAAIATGHPVIVVDDRDRENEGDLIMAADAVSADDVAFFLRHTSGVLCVAASGERLDALELPLMVPERNTEALGIGSLPDYLTGDFPDLVHILPEEKSATIPIYLAYVEELRHSKRVGAFRDFVLEEISAYKRGERLGSGAAASHAVTP